MTMVKTDIVFDPKKKPGMTFVIKGEKTLGFIFKAISSSKETKQPAPFAKVNAGDRVFMGLQTDRTGNVPSFVEPSYEEVKKKVLAINW